MPFLPVWNLGVRTVFSYIILGHIKVYHLHFMLLQNLDGTYVKKQGRKSRESKEEGHIAKKQEKKSRVSKKEGHSSGKIFYISQTPDVMGHNCSQNLHMSQEAKAVGHNPTKNLYMSCPLLIPAKMWGIKQRKEFILPNNSKQSTKRSELIWQDKILEQNHTPIHSRYLFSQHTMMTARRMQWTQHGAESVKETRFLSASVPDIRQQRISREPGH